MRYTPPAQEEHALDYRWIPLFGEFEIASDRLRFKGGRMTDTRPTTEPVPSPDSPPEAPEVKVVYNAGLALTNHTMLNGRINATVIIEREVAPNSVCELVFAHNIKSKAHLAAGIGGGGFYSVRAWAPAVTTQQGASSSQGPAKSTWLPIDVGGDKRNLRSGIPYEISVAVAGLTVTLQIDGVAVAASTLPPPGLAAPGQFGIFCFGESDITISNFRAQIERPKAFIVMQFSSPYNEVYSHVIKDVCDKFKINPIRADEIYGPGIIIKDVVDKIADSQVIIADISPDNLNVYFEVGYALALRKPIILLAQRRAPSSSLPFDLSPFRVLFYDDSIGGKPNLEKELSAHLRKIFGEQESHSD